MLPARVILALMVAATAVTAQGTTTFDAVGGVSPGLVRVGEGDANFTTPLFEAPAISGSVDGSVDGSSTGSTEPTVEFPPTSSVPVPTATHGVETPQPNTTAPIGDVPTPEVTMPVVVPKCIEIKDRDHVGFDIKNVPGKSFDTCAPKCFSTPGCVTFSWSDHEGGTCWLKNGFGDQVDKPGVSTAQCQDLNVDPVCIEKKNRDVEGCDLTNVRGATFDSCIKPCLGTPGCVTFSWSDYEGGTCWLKSALSPQIDKPGVSTAMCTAFSSGECSEIKNKDRVGADLSNVRGQFKDCAGHCKATKGCVTFSWSDHEGGTCWLKSSDAPFLNKQGVSTTACTYGTPGPVPSVCKQYKDVDIVGNDIGSRSGKRFDECCGLCSVNSRCKAYSWTDYEGGTCWFKGAVGQLIFNPGVISSANSISGPVCPFEKDVDFVGNDVGNKPAKDAGVCCDACKATAACKAYTWSNHNGGTCWMKSAKGKVVAAKGLVSAKLV